MPLDIPNFPDPQAPGSAWASAWAWVVGVSLDQVGGAASVVVSIHPSSADWQGQPARRAVTTGEVLVPAVPADPAAVPPVAGSPAVAFPTLASFMADPAFAQAFATIQAKIEAAIAAPEVAAALGLAGATVTAS